MIKKLNDFFFVKEFINLNKNHQLSQLNTEELKKFAAVNLLLEATSSTSIKEQDVSIYFILFSFLFL